MKLSEWGELTFPPSGEGNVQNAAVHSPFPALPRYLMDGHKPPDASFLYIDESSFPDLFQLSGYRTGPTDRASLGYTLRKTTYQAVYITLYSPPLRRFARSAWVAYFDIGKCKKRVKVAWRRWYVTIWTSFGGNSSGECKLEPLNFLAGGTFPVIHRPLQS
jgi:hypothetical protein